MRELFLITIAFYCQDIVAQDTASWLGQIVRNIELKEIHTIVTSAQVSVSDGMKYKSSTIYHDPQRAIWKVQYPERQSIIGVEGMYYWMFDGVKSIEGNEMTRTLALGHQMHAQLLFFDKLHSLSGKRTPVKFQNQDAISLDADEYSLVVREDNFPLGLKLTLDDRVVTYVFEDFRLINGLNLPFKIIIDDESRVFTYSFDSIIINEGSMDDFRPPIEQLTDEHQLLRLHRIAMDDHFFERTDGIKTNQADNWTYIGGGEIYRMSRMESNSGIDRIMSSRFHTTYDDLVRPTVKVSNDGTLGWVIAKIEAKGMRLDQNGNETEPLHFVCSWIMLYEKVDGRWMSVGNASTFQD